MAVQRRLKKGSPQDKGQKPKWVARYRDAAGREHSKTFDTEKQAKAFIAETKSSIRRGTWADPATQKITTAELITTWADRPLREGTKRSYLQTRAQLGPLADLPIASVTRTDTDAWHKQLRTGRAWIPGDTGLAATTAREHMTRLSTAFGFAVEMDWLFRNPVKVPSIKSEGITTVSRSEIPTAHQIGQILALLESGGAVYQSRIRKKTGGWTHSPTEAAPDPAVADMVRAAVGTGERVSELCGMQVRDVKFLRRVVHVENQISVNGKELVPTKSAESVREIPVGDDLLKVLDQRCAGKDPEDFVFTNRSGRPYRASTAGGSLRKAARHLGMPFTFHSFRHYYASLLIDSGVSVAGVQAAMGHANPSITLETYTHLWPGQEDVTRRAISGAVEACGISAGSAPYENEEKDA